MTRRTPVSTEEQETIINFNKADPMASIFTYEESWQKHLEERLGLKPIHDNGYGAREYLIDKKRIRPPRPLVKMTPEQAKVATARLERFRAKTT